MFPYKNKVFCLIHYVINKLRIKLIKKHNIISTILFFFLLSIIDNSVTGYFRGQFLPFWCFYDFVFKTIKIKHVCR